VVAQSSETQWQGFLLVSTIAQIIFYFRIFREKMNTWPVHFSCRRMFLKTLHGFTLPVYPLGQDGTAAAERQGTKAMHLRLKK